MNSATTNDELRGPNERRKRVRRAEDREAATRSAREAGRCAEPGCEEKVWLGGEYCIWHPRIELDLSPER